MMKIKTGDNVMVTSGKDNGKKGKVIQVFAADKKVVVDGVNKVVKHLKPRRSDQKGQRLEFFGPIHAANVMLVCPNCKKSTRIGFKIEGDEKFRVCKKCNQIVK